jgi:cytochrome c peroxidase
MILVTLVALALPGATGAQLPPLDPSLVRAAARQMGMDSLSKVVLTDPPTLLLYVRGAPPVADATTNPVTVAPPATLTAYATSHNMSVQRAALLILGKALFWDQQVGSDGQACASCHFQAGADVRSVNSLNPGSRNTDPQESVLYNAKGSGGVGAPNNQLVAGDFPFHKLADPLQTNYMNREVLFDTDDVVGSIGTFHATFTGSPAPVYATANALGVYDSFAAIAPAAEPVFKVGSIITRSNGPRQAGPVVNAVFNFRNFWDGRADNAFNGINPFGTKDQTSMILWNNGTGLGQDFALVANSSLASQSTGPINSALSDEMAFAGRTVPDLGRKLLRLTGSATTPGGADNVTGLPNVVNVIPLGAQLVSRTDSVLGSFVAGTGGTTGQGLNTTNASVTYRELIQWAFVPQYWNGTGPADPVTGLPTRLLTAQGFALMEHNFALFWGLAIQAYETTLRADQSPFDKFMAGDNAALTQTQMRGLLTYIHTENSGQQVNPIFNNINFGACQLCHSGPELTENSLTNVPLKLFVATDMTVKMDHNRELAIVPAASNFDVGFTNVGSRPNREDVGLGGTVLNGLPLSLFRAGQQGFIFGMPALAPAKPNPTRGTNTDGAFKIAHLRNVELTGPYFHNGGTLTLKQAVEFYARHGDFADVNEPDIDVGLAMVQNIGSADADLLVGFLLSLTDERTRLQQAPFDHPQLIIPNGNNTAQSHPVLLAPYAADIYLTLPAVGSAGSTALTNFLGISSIPVAGPNNDHFDP